MAQVTVAFGDYQSGSLPDVCVFTGEPTSDRMVLRTRIVERDPATKPPGPVLGFLARTTLFENPRAPRNLLVGKLPVDAGHLLARQRKERVLRLGGWVSVLSLVVAAVSAQPWAPLLAIASILLPVSTWSQDLIFTSDDDDDELLLDEATVNFEGAIERLGELQGRALGVESSASDKAIRQLPRPKAIA